MKTALIYSPNTHAVNLRSAWCLGHVGAVGDLWTITSIHWGSENRTLKDVNFILSRAVRKWTAGLGFTRCRWWTLYGIREKVPFEGNRCVCVPHKDGGWKSQPMEKRKKKTDHELPTWVGSDTYIWWCLLQRLALDFYIRAGNTDRLRWLWTSNPFTTHDSVTARFCRPPLGFDTDWMTIVFWALLWCSHLTLGLPNLPLCPLSYFSSWCCWQINFVLTSCC